MLIVERAELAPALASRLRHFVENPGEYVRLIGNVGSRDEISFRLEPTVKFQDLLSDLRLA